MADGTYGLGLRGSNASCTLAIDLGDNESVGVAARETETGSFQNVRIGGAGEVTIGSGCIIAGTLSVTGGEVWCRTTSLGTVKNYGGELHVVDSAAIANLDCYAGTTYYEAGATITSAEVFPGATLDLHTNRQAKVLQSVTLHGGATIDIRGGHVTHATNWILSGCAPNDVSIIADQGNYVTLAPI
jgi:hypothetical protein